MGEQGRGAAPLPRGAVAEKGATRASQSAQKGLPFSGDLVTEHRLDCRIPDHPGDERVHVADLGPATVAGRGHARGPGGTHDRGVERSAQRCVDSSQHVAEPVALKSVNRAQHRIARTNQRQRSLHTSDGCIAWRVRGCTGL